MFNEKTYVNRIIVELYQDGNTLGTTDDTEQLTVQTDTQLPGEPPFFVIKTNGWSIDGHEDMATIIRAVQSAHQQIQEAVNGKNT